jgi:hypothetical protein
MYITKSIRPSSPKDFLKKFCILSDSMRWMKKTMWILSWLFILAVSGNLAGALETEEAGEAIVINPIANIRSGANTQSQIVFKAHEGDRLKILAKNEDWYEVRLSNGKTGWLKAIFLIPKEAVGALALPDPSHATK